MLVGPLKIRSGDWLLWRFQGEYACESVMLHFDATDVTCSVGLEWQIQPQGDVLLIRDSDGIRCPGIQPPFIGERFEAEQNLEKSYGRRSPFDAFRTDSGLARGDEAARVFRIHRSISGPSNSYV